MAAPGFTADESVYRSARYYSTGGVPSGYAGGLVEPQSFKGVLQGIGVGASLGAAIGDLGGGLGTAVGGVVGGVIGGLVCGIISLFGGDCA
jgi:hypothetical protein